MPIFDNVTALASQYLQMRTAQKQAEATGAAQHATYNAADGVPKVGANPTPVVEQVAQQQVQQKNQTQTMLLVGGAVVAAVVLLKVI